MCSKDKFVMEGPSMGKLLNKDLYRSAYNNYVRHSSKQADSHNSANSPKLAVNHTFPTTGLKYTLFAPIGQIRRQFQCRQTARPLPCHMPMSVIESGPQQVRGGPLRANNDLKHYGWVAIVNCRESRVTWMDKR